MPDRWEHRVEVFGMEWRRQERLPDAEGLQRKLSEWGSEGWELVAFEMVRDEHTVEVSAGAADASPTAAYLVILKRLLISGSSAVSGGRMTCL